MRDYPDGLMQKKRNSSALAMELRPFCFMQSICGIDAPGICFIDAPYYHFALSNHDNLWATSSCNSYGLSYRELQALMQNHGVNPKCKNVECVP